MAKRTVEEILMEATGVKKKKGESRQDFLKRLIAGCDGMADKKWEGLGKEAQSWINDAIDARNDKKKIAEIPGITANGDDDDEEEDDDEEAEDDDDEEGEEEADEDDDDDDEDEEDDEESEDDDEEEADDDDDDDDEEASAKKKGKELSKKSSSKKSDDNDEDDADEEDEDDEAPKAKKSKSDDDDDEEKPVKKAKKGSGTKAKFRRLFCQDPEASLSKLLARAAKKNIEIAEATASTVYYEGKAFIRELEEQGRLRPAKK